MIYYIHTKQIGGEKLIDVITSIANLIASLLALITAIIAYKLASK